MNRTGMKITRVVFNNYRAFFGVSDPIEVGGKNLLIYGENGSGKSSIYQGLKDYFKAFDITWTIEKSPRHLKADTDDYEVRLSFDPAAAETAAFTGQQLEDEALGQTFLLNSFLSYKELLRTHLVEGDALDAKIFELLTDILLRENEIGDSTVGKTLEEILRLQTSRKTEDKDRRDNLLISFNALFPDMLRKISEQCQKMLSSFDKALTVEFRPSDTSIEKIKDEKGHIKRRLKGTVGLDITYLGIANVDYREVLNEARLSALAISIYLAAIVINPIAQRAEFKILFLDDIFIGLDMSNRLPLLRILEEFSLDGGNPFFSDFQIFLTTYDRYWYEIAKKRLSSWAHAELFVGDEKDAEGNKLFEKPVVIQKSLSNLERAKRFLESFDYFSAGNSLRKAFEEELEKLVPDTYRIDVEKLETLIDRLFLYYHECACDDLIPAGLKFQLKTFKDSVLNPSSHFDLKSTLYRGEIEETFRLLEQVKQLPFITKGLMLGMRSPIVYVNVGKQYKVEVILRENIYKVTAEGGQARITDPKVSLNFWSLSDVEFSKPDASIFSKGEIDNLRAAVTPLSDFSTKIQHFLTLVEPPDWKEFLNSEGKTLTELAAEE